MPGIVHQAYLGPAEKLTDLARERTVPIPLAAYSRPWRPAALGSADQHTDLQTGHFRKPLS